MAPESCDVTQHVNSNATDVAQLGRLRATSSCQTRHSALPLLGDLVQKAYAWVKMELFAFIFWSSAAIFPKNNSETH